MGASEGAGIGQASRGGVHFSVTTLAHIPAQFLELAAHLCLSLAQIAGRGGQDAALQVHLLAATTWLMGRLVLLNIAADLAGGEVAVSARVRGIFGTTRLNSPSADGTLHMLCVLAASSC